MYGGHSWRGYSMTKTYKQVEKNKCKNRVYKIQYVSIMSINHLPMYNIKNPIAAINPPHTSLLIKIK